MNEKPIPESYWVIPGRLLAGGYPGLRFDELRLRQRIVAFLAAGFDTFIDLTNGNERPPYSSMLNPGAGTSEGQVLYRRFSFPDFAVPSHASMAAALDAIDSALAGGRKTYLHCVGGVGRTGMTVGCYFVRHGLKPGAAVRKLRSLYATSAQSLIFPDSPETLEQVNFILNWKEDGLA